jgi:hypothetical protein
MQTEKSNYLNSLLLDSSLLFKKILEHQEHFLITGQKIIGDLEFKDLCM